MYHVALANETDLEGWRIASRTLALNTIAPSQITWSVEGHGRELFGSTQIPAIAGNPRFTVSSAFLDLAGKAILHRDPARFALLYQMVWRLRAEPELMTLVTDPEIIRLKALARDVGRDIHKMHAFVRFREIGRERHARFVAWFEPAHHIVEAAVPFFEGRFADRPWSILTPDRCAHWDGSKTIFTEGATKQDAPASDPLEDIWRSYYASIFNPARLKIKAMKAEMPVKYWRNLPEASLISPLIAQAGHSVKAMIDAGAAAPLVSPQRREQPMARKSTATDALEKLREEAADCRACPLWKDATQTVFGEGPSRAPIMIIGEQPGDKEDLAGKPFVGPAGQMLDRALKEAGIDRDQVYVTNAVKHFKFVPRGKIRLHQKPNTAEIKACRPWYERERAALKPALVVALGATAAQSVFGKATAINKSRGRLIDLDDGTKALVTVHPSYLLRLPDAETKAQEYEKFVDDLKMAAEFLHHLRRSSHAA